MGINNTGFGFSHALRSERFKQVIVFNEVCLILVLTRKLVDGELLHALLISIVMLLLLPAWIFAKKQRPVITGGTLLSVLILFMMGFMWFQQGVRDEIILLFPIILIISIYIGNHLVPALISVFVITNILLIGYFNEIHVITHQVTGNSFSSSIFITIMLASFSFCIYLITTDFKTAYNNLLAENMRVSESQLKIDTLTNYDTLTGLPNSMFAKDWFMQAFRKVRNNSKTICMMFIDLDNFKDINESLGHKAGDVYLIHIAKCLQNSLRDDDAVCRLGGDEFLIILDSIKSRDDVLIVANKLKESIKKPIQISDKHVVSTISIGVALVPEDGNDFDRLYTNAEIALHQVKDSGKNNIGFFDRGMANDASSSLVLHTDLHLAIAQNQLELFYQPQIDLKTGDIIAAEALLRWHHPDKGMVPPLEFISIAEKSGLIVDIGEWVIDQVCQKIVSWNSLHYFKLQKIAVNVSPLQFRHGDLASFVLDKLAAYQLNGSSVELEFTESLLMEIEGSIKDQIHRIRNAGVHLSIDDFGTGYSNLGYLTKCDIDVLKIDRSFVLKMMEHMENQAIIQAIIQLANRLHVQTIAEGIENQETADLLWDLGCNLGQGYLWARPMPGNKFLEFLQQRT